MSVHVESTHRFLRAADAGRTRRNQKKVQAQRVLAVARSIAITAAFAAGALWLLDLTRSDPRFSVRQVEIVGAVHTPAAAVQAATRRYQGLNLFRIDVNQVRRDFSSVSWIRNVEIEKKLPNTLRITLVERVPVALLRTDDARIHYVDVSGMILASLSPSVGNDDLPLIAGATGPEVERAVRFLTLLRQRDVALYQRVSEIRPVVPRSFAIFDRDLSTLVYVSEEDVVGKWRTLYALAGAEKYARGSLEYADLRFNGRLVLKPFARPVALPPHVSAPTVITN